MNTKLPNGWVKGKIRDVVKGITGGVSTKKSDYTDSGVLVLNKGDIKKFGKVALKDNPNRVAEELATRNENKIVNKGSLLVTLRDLSNKADFLGLISIYPHREKALITQGMYSLELYDETDKRLLVHYSNSPQYRKIVKQNKVGATQVHLRNDQFLDIEFPIAPSQEQKLIADKLDCLLGKVDACKARLDKVPEIIKRFRQSVLADATSGRLTEDWRANNSLEFNWTASRIEDLIEGIRYGTSKKCSYENGSEPVLRIPNIGDYVIDKSDLKYADFNEKEIKSLSLSEGDLLLIRSNGSASLVGKVNIISKEEEGYVYAGYLIRLRLKKELINPHYLMFYLSSPKIRSWIETGARSTSGIHNINSKEISSIEVSLPSIEEQIEIVKQVESLFSIADQMEEKLKRAHTGVEKLTASILAKAFRGELCSKDAKKKLIETNTKKRTD